LNEQKKIVFFVKYAILMLTKSFWVSYCQSQEIYAETKDMNFEEYKAYLNRRLKNSALLARMQRRQGGMIKAGGTCF
jgi:hypothetical protein